MYMPTINIHVSKAINYIIVCTPWIACSQFVQVGYIVLKMNVNIHTQ